MNVVRHNLHCMWATVVVEKLGQQDKSSSRGFRSLRPLLKSTLPLHSIVGSMSLILYPL